MTGREPVRWWPPLPATALALVLVIAGWWWVLTSIDVDLDPSNPRRALGWPFVYRAVDETPRHLDDGSVVFMSGWFMPIALAADLAVAAGTLATSYAFVQLVGPRGGWTRRFTLAEMLLIIAACALPLGIFTAFPPNAQLVAGWGFLFGISSPLLLLGLRIARGKPAGGRETPGVSSAQVAPRERGGRDGRPNDGERDVGSG